MTMKTRIFYGNKDITDEHLDYLQNLKRKVNEDDYMIKFVYFCFNGISDVNVFEAYGLDDIIIDDESRTEVNFNFYVFDITDEYIVSSYDWLGIVWKNILKITTEKHSFYLSDFKTFEKDDKIFLSIYGGFSEKEGRFDKFFNKMNH